MFIFFFFLLLMHVTNLMTDCARKFPASEQGQGCIYINTDRKFLQFPKHELNWYLLFGHCSSLNYHGFSLFLSAVDTEFF